MPRDDTALHAGDPAPEFRLPTGDGSVHSLAAYRAQGRKVALFFFRGTWCHTCQQQIAELRAHYPALTAQGWAVLGLAAQAADALASYARLQSIPFPLMSDSDRAVSRLYGVYTVFTAEGLGIPTINAPHNATFLIDTGDCIRLVHVGMRSSDVLTGPALLAALAAVTT